MWKRGPFRLNRFFRKIVRTIITMRVIIIIQYLSLSIREVKFKIVGSR